MDSTVIVAALGFTATIVASSLTARSQRQGDREGRILEAQVRTYGECSASLFEYARANYNRSKARLNSRPDSEREVLRQEAYRANARARSAIGQAYVLTGNEDLEDRLSQARREIRKLTDASDRDVLARRQEAVYVNIKEALAMARSDLAGHRHGYVRR